jgi:PKD repeat protein
MAFSAFLGLLALVSLLSASRAAAAGPTVPAYGEVARFGGLDTGAQYQAASTTGLKGSGEAKLVDPIGMAVDTSDATVPNEYAIYVLDNVNPQALNGLELARFTSLKLEYRLQKISVTGQILASKTFTLQSSTGEPGLHATSLAVDGPGDRVYVLIADTPATTDNEGPGANAADRVDVWTAGRNHDEALAAAPEPKEDSAVKAGELVAAATLQPGKTSIVSDINATSIAVDQTASGVDLALAGNEFTAGEPGRTTAPVIKLISTGGATPGSIAATSWKGASAVKATEDEAAEKWGQKSQKLFSLSASPDGSLNLALGAPSFNVGSTPDEEPNMAKVSSDLVTTTPVLPWASAAAEGTEAVNYDRAATVQFSQDVEGAEHNALERSGATAGAGTLAPSVVPLAEEAGRFPGALYAGLVVQEPGVDSQNPVASSFSWTFGRSAEKEGLLTAPSPVSSLAIRVFDAQGESLAMIGNVTPGGPCNLQGGPAGENSYTDGSFVALAPGRGGALFALAQPDLTGVAVAPGTESHLIAPGSAVGAGAGDQILELAPGAGQGGTSGQECPQPAGGFSIANETVKSAASKGTGPVTVSVGTKLKFDAGEVNLQGGSPWTYDWTSGEGAVQTDTTWHSAGGWKWPGSTAEFEYKTPGTYAAKLSLVNDFDTLTAERTVNVVKAEPITGAKIVVSGTLAASQQVGLQASATLPAFDSVQAYHWDFGDGQGEDRPGSQPQVEHAYATPGSYSVKLTITDALGQKAQAAETIAIAPANTGGGGGGGGGQGGGTTSPINNLGSNPGAGTVQTKGATTTSTGTLTRAQLLTKALKACKKMKPKKRRAGCEKQAKKKYGPKPVKRKGKRKR